MIFLSLLTVVSYALFGVPPIAPVTPVLPADPVRLPPHQKMKQHEKSARNSREVRPNAKKQTNDEKPRWKSGTSVPNSSENNPPSARLPARKKVIQSKKEGRRNKEESAKKEGNSEIRRWQPGTSVKRNSENSLPVRRPAGQKQPKKQALTYPEGHAKNSISENRPWQSETLVPKKGKINHNSGKKKNVTLIPRSNRGFELRKSACFKKDSLTGSKSSPLPRPANKSSSYVLKRPSVQGIPTIGPSRSVGSESTRATTLNATTLARTSKTMRANVQKTLTRKAGNKKSDNTYMECTLKNRVFISNQVAEKPKQSVSTPFSSGYIWSGLRSQIQRVFSPLTNVITGGYHGEKHTATNPKSRHSHPKRNFLNQTISSIAKVTRDPRTKKVTVWKTQTRPLPKSRPSAAPLPPPRWRF